MTRCAPSLFFFVVVSAFTIPQPALAAGSAPDSVSAACTLAIGTPKTKAFIWTPPEELTSMFWKIPACAACEGSGVTAKSLSFRLRWFGPCSGQAQVLVVGSRTGANGVEPDTTAVLCPPASYPINSTVNDVIPCTLAFTPGSCFTGTAFAVVRFTGLGGCGTDPSPGLIGSTAACVRGDQFVTAAHVFPGLTEWSSIGAVTATWFSIDLDCCATAPRPKSPRKTKTRHR